MLACGELVWGGIGRRSELREPAVESVTLKLEDLVQLALEVVEDGLQVEALEGVAALLAQLLEDVAEAVEAGLAVWAQAALQHVAQGVLQVAEVHEVVGQALKEVVGVERRELLGPVPLAVEGFARSWALAGAGPAQPRYCVWPPTRSRLRRLLRCRPSNTNSIAAAVRAGSPWGASWAAPSARPATWSRSPA